MNNPASNRVRDFATRINNCMKQQKALGDDIKEIKKEAASEGYDDKAIARAVRLLRKDKRKREEDQRQLDLVLECLDGMDFSED